MAATREALEKAVFAEFATSRWDGYKTLESLVDAGATLKNRTERDDFAHHIATAMLRAILESHD
jgi:hypothetical protein